MRMKRKMEMTSSHLCIETCNSFPNRLLVMPRFRTVKIVENLPRRRRGGIGPVWFDVLDAVRAAPVVGSAG